MRFRLLLNIVLAGVLFITPVFIMAQDSSATEVPSGVTIHVVQRGENLFRIALKYGTTVNELASLNGLSDPTRILVGQRLLVPTTVTVEATPQTHTVQPGETLSTIADLYQTDVDTLISLNNLSDANQIYPGQVLVIVASEQTPEAIVEATESPTAAPEATESVNNVAMADNGYPTISTNLHIVQSGETMFKIALMYGLTVQELANANGITDPTVIYVGQQLIIPGISESPTAELDLPAPITDLQVRPLIFVEGETGLIEISTSIGSTISGTFLGRNLSIIPQENKTKHIIILGIPMFTEADIYPVELSLSNDDGTQTSFAFNLRVVMGAYGTQNLNITEADLAAPAVQDNELNLLSNLTSAVTLNKYWNGPFSIPAAAAMNGPFGTRRSYNGGPVDTFHTGADFASAPGTAILAAAPGKVVLADTLNIRGNTVVIDHGWGVYTLYAHQTTIKVALGDMVDTGQVIGTAGSTGRVTGPHLHWELWINGVPVNPLTWTQQEFP